MRVIICVIGHFIHFEAFSMSLDLFNLSSNEVYARILTAGIRNSEWGAYSF